jgi:hypothetical protein
MASKNRLFLYMCVSMCVCVSGFENSNEPAIREMELRDSNANVRRIQLVEY